MRELLLQGMLPVSPEGCWSQQQNCAVCAPACSGGCRRLRMAQQGQSAALGSGNAGCKCPLPSWDHKKGGETKQSRVRIQVGFAACLRGCFQPWKSSECLKNSWVPGSKTQMFFFSCTSGQQHRIALLSWRKNPHPSHPKPSVPLWSLASHRGNLEWGCPGQGCSGLWLIFSSCLFSSDLCKPAVITQCRRVTQSRGAVTTLVVFQAQGTVWLSEYILWQSF